MHLDEFGADGVRKRLRLASRCPLTAEVPVRFLVSPCVIAVDEVIMRQILSECFGFSLSLLFHQCCILIFMFLLLFAEGHASETRVPSKKQRFFFPKMEEHWTIK